MLAWNVTEGPSCIALGVVAGFGNLLGDPRRWDIGIRHGHGPSPWNWAKIQRLANIQTLDQLDPLIFLILLAESNRFEELVGL